MLLAIDIGNSNISVGLFDKAGSEIPVLHRHRQPQNGGSDQHRSDEHLFPVSLRPAGRQRGYLFQRGAAHQLHDGQSSDPASG